VTSLESIGRPIGSCFALTAFAIAIVAGLLAQNDAVTVLGRAIVVLIGCRVLGAMFGWVLARVGAESLDMQTQMIEALETHGAVVPVGVEVSDGGEVDVARGRRAA
jgi:putative effector of murein hydrolase